MMTGRRTIQGLPACRARRAFSLIELVASMAVVAILLAAMSSTVLLASRAVPDEDASSVYTSTAARALEQIAAELETATGIKKASSDELNFAVPDRDGDGNGEAIRYKWHSKSSLLRRKYNNGSYEDWLEGVQTFDVSTQTVTVVDDTEAPMVLGSEQQLFSQSSFDIGYVGSASLTSGVRIAEAFVPTYTGSTRWQPTRWAARMPPDSPADGQLKVVLRDAANDGSPDREMTSATVDESDLSSYLYTFEDFDSSPDLSLGETYFLSIEHVSGDNAGKPRIGNSTTYGQYKDTGGGTWSVTTGGLWVIVWGKPYIPDPDWTQSKTDFVRRVILTLDTGGSSLTTVRTSTTLLNQPEAP